MTMGELNNSVGEVSNIKRTGRHNFDSSTLFESPYDMGRRKCINGRKYDKCFESNVIGSRKYSSCLNVYSLENVRSDIVNNYQPSIDCVVVRIYLASGETSCLFEDRSGN
jgi:hypothetical protein